MQNSPLHCPRTLGATYPSKAVPAASSGSSSGATCRAGDGLTAIWDASRLPQDAVMHSHAPPGLPCKPHRRELLQLGALHRLRVNQCLLIASTMSQQPSIA